MLSTRALRPRCSHWPAASNMTAPHRSHRQHTPLQTHIEAVSTASANLLNLEAGTDAQPRNADSARQLEQQQQYSVLESAAAGICHARISTDTPSGCRGLVATCELSPGQVVLSVPATLALSVPRQHPLRDVQAKAVAAWRQWLQKSQAEYGALPGVLISFLAGMMCFKLGV